MGRDGQGGRWSSRVAKDAGRAPHARMGWSGDAWNGYTTHAGWRGVPVLHAGLGVKREGKVGVVRGGIEEDEESYGEFCTL